MNNTVKYVIGGILAISMIFCSLVVSQFFERLLVLAYSDRLTDFVKVSIDKRIGDVYVLSDYSRIALTETQSSSLTFMRIVVLFLVYAIFMYSAQYISKRFFGIDFLEETRK